MKKFKKSLAIILAVVMLISVLSFGASATNGYEDVTVNGLKMQFGDPNTNYPATSPEKDMHLAVSGYTVTVTYTGSLTYYYPNELAFFVTTGKTSIASFSSSDGITVTPTIKTSTGEYQTTDDVTSGFYIIQINNYNASTSNITRSLTITKTNNTTVTLNFSIPQTVTSGGSGVVSYLPAPGQFVNEGIGTGGWGDIYQSGSSNVKNMVGNVCGTGVSLGAFGGSIVFDLGEDGVDNGTSNPYGVDFIIYGNAFGNNAEPGCVQVAPDANSDGIPDKWYDVAGSLYYSGETVTMYYSDPTPADNTSAGTNNPTSTRANVPYSTNVTISGNTQTWTNSSSLTTNTFHNHSWFPLARNYFDGTERNAKTYNSTDASGAMANVGSLTPATGSNPISVMEGQTIVGGLSSTTVISYSGRKLPWVSGAPTSYQFGYADVHANGSSYGTAVNPYDSTITSGGDGIDISWAVNTDGTPANLTNIRFVRVYTGVQQINNPFGEVSTEVCGIYVATPSTGTVGTTTAPSAVSFICKHPVTGTVINTYSPSIPSNGGSYSCVSTIINNANSAGASNVDVSITAPSGAYIYVNDVLLSETGTSGTNAVYTGKIPKPTSGQCIRVIVQESTKEPYLFLYT